MDFLQVYTIVVGVLLLTGTLLSVGAIMTVKSSRRPLYVMKAVAGALLSATFALGYLLRFESVVLPTNLFFAFYYLSFVAVALVFIVAPLVDRYEAKKLSDGKP